MSNMAAVRPQVQGGINSMAAGAARVSAPPKCNGCGRLENVAPSVIAERAPYFCIRCCNYLDTNGAISA